MKCARDVCDQLETLMERVEIYLVSAKCSHSPKQIIFGYHPRWIVYFDLVFTSKEYMRQVGEELKIIRAISIGIAPHYYKAKDIQDDVKASWI